MKYLRPATPPVYGRAGPQGPVASARPVAPRALSGAGLLRDPDAVIALWRWDGPDDPVAWLAGHGWEAEVFDREERARAYGRPLEVAEAEGAATRTVLIDARRL